MLNYVSNYINCTDASHGLLPSVDIHSCPYVGNPCEYVHRVGELYPVIEGDLKFVVLSSSKMEKARISI